jgi:hypothetical protein
MVSTPGMGHLETMPTIGIAEDIKLTNKFAVND